MPPDAWLRRAPRGAMGLLVLVLTATLAATGCNRPAPPGGGGGEGPGHRPQRLALTPEQEYSLGEQAYKEVLAKARAEGTLISAGPPVKRVARVGSRIAKVAEGNELLQKEINLHLRGYKFDWEFNVIRSKQINAFCLPGGKIAVYTGLLQLVGDNDNWLATVLGHEIAHALAHHSSERIARENMTRQAIRAAEGALGRLDPSQRKLLIGLLAGGAQIRGLAYDRQQESEADHIGVFLMTFAGYDPDAAITFWERMAEAARGRHPPAILSTHPSDAQRIKQLRAWVVKAKEAKKAYDEGRVVR